MRCLLGSAHGNGVRTANGSLHRYDDVSNVECVHSSHPLVPILLVLLPTTVNSIDG